MFLDIYQQGFLIMEERDSKLSQAFGPLLGDNHTIPFARQVEPDEDMLKTKPIKSPRRPQTTDPVDDTVPLRSQVSDDTIRLDGYSQDEASQTISHRSKLRRYNIHHQDTKPVRDDRPTEAGFRLHPAVLEPDESITEPSFVGSLSELKPTKPRLRMTVEYISKRLDLSIAEAQHDGAYKEAIRLQLLQWYLHDEKLSPVEVARRAWLQSNT